MMKYYILEQTDGDKFNIRVIPAGDLTNAYRLWLEHPIYRTIVKEVKPEVIER